MNRKLVEYKMKFVLGAVMLVLLVLLAKISYLQLVQTEEYRTMARNNYIRIVPVFAPRGEIFDRDGEKIVTNRPIYTVSINDLNLQGTTYRLYLDRTGADAVRMADMLAWILAGDEEAVLYFKQISDQELVIGDNLTEAEAYTVKKKFIEETIKDRISDNKAKLETGKPLEIGVAYHPETINTLRRQDLASFGVRMEKKTDELSDLVAMLFDAGVYKDETPYEVESRVRQNIMDKKLYRPYEPVLVAEDIPLQVVVALREKQMDLPGAVVDIKPTRAYPHKELLSHVLGYVQNINAEQYREHKDEGYLMNDLFGQNGLEKVYEKYLRGENGARQVEVDASSRPVRDLGMKQPVPGNDLVLTIDLDLQKAAEQALADGVRRARQAGYIYSKGGAAVVMDVHTGAVLAMASYPGFEPQLFEGGLSETQYRELQESKALMNRAITGLYPPGSTFKMVTAAAILENKVVDPEYKMPDPGYFMLGNGRFRDWKPGGHGAVDLREALGVSCDTYFYKFGLQAGVNAIAHYAREFGLGKKTGINLPGEVSGTVPTPEYKYEKEKNFLVWTHEEFAQVRELNRMIEEAESEARKQQLVRLRDKELEKQLKKFEWDLHWHAYDTVNMSTGQGYNMYTPLQLAAYVTAIANGGTLYRPYLVDKIVSSDGKVVKEFAPKVRQKVDIKPDNLQIIREGMHMVTLPPAGTAAAVFAGAKYTAAAKTGTAENEKGEGNAHALFVSFAPYEKPEVAVAVVLEYGHSGSGYAGPIARQILDAYFAGKKSTGPGAATEQEPGGSTNAIEPPDRAEAEQADNLIDWAAIPSLSWPGWETEPGPEPAPARPALQPVSARSGDQPAEVTPSNSPARASQSPPASQNTQPAVQAQPVVQPGTSTGQPPPAVAPAEQQPAPAVSPSPAATPARPPEQPGGPQQAQPASPAPTPQGEQEQPAPPPVGPEEQVENAPNVVEVR